MPSVNVNTTTPVLDARLFRSVVLAVAPAVTMDDASSLSGVNLKSNYPRFKRSGCGSSQTLKPIAHSSGPTTGSAAADLSYTLLTLRTLNPPRYSSQN